MRLALICPPYASHLRGFRALARVLEGRGHDVVSVLPDGVEAEGQIMRLGAVPDAGSLRKGAIGESVRRTELLCRNAHRFAGFDAIVGDQTEPASGLIAAHFAIPLISVACALPLNHDPAIPLPFLEWSYDPSDRGLRRNLGGERVAGWVLRRQNAVIREWGERLGVPGFARLADCVSATLTLSQTLPGFDYPRDAAVVEIGPLRDAEPRGWDFVPPRDKPFVYASLGTLQGNRLRLLRVIADGCRDAGVQLMVSHCGGLTAREEKLVGADWVLGDVPQEAVLDHAALCITHGGLNTTMEALERRVPLVVIPLAFDQFGVAARVEWHGVGIRLSRHLISRTKVRRAVERGLRDPSFARNLERFGPGPGLDAAVRMIEDQLRGAQPLVAAQ